MKIFNFIPAGAFLLTVIFLIVRIRFLKNNGIRLYSRGQKTQKRPLLILPAFLILSLLWLFEISKPAFYISYYLLPGFLTTNFSDSNTLNYTGTILIIFSQILFVLTLLHFKTSLRFGLDPGNTGTLITTGVFSISRNPFFLSLDLYFLGVALIFPNLFFIAFAVLAAISIHLFILKEERFLRKTYGEEYKKYTRRTGRYLSYSNIKL